MAGSIAIGIACWPTGASFRQAPVGAEPTPYGFGQNDSIRFAGGLEPDNILTLEIEQAMAGAARVDDTATEIIG